MKRVQLIALDMDGTLLSSDHQTVPQKNIDAIRRAEKKRIMNALQQTGNNKTKAALLLGIDRKTLYNKMKLYNIG